MAFVDCIGADNKQRINLSQFACNIINDDMIAFGNNQITNFINVIIANFKHESEASISFVLEKEKQKLEDSLVGYNNSQKELIIKSLLTLRKKDLIQKFSSFEKSKSYIVRLWNETVDYLTDAYSECKEDKYYDGKVGKYLKAIIEDYATRSFQERERIYYYDRIKLINKAISEKRGLSIKLLNGNHFYIYPYKIASDPMSMYNYLVGYSLNDDEAKKQATSMRISKIADIKLKGTGKRLTKDDVKSLEETIRKKGVQFLTGSETLVVVQLTEKGKQRFVAQLHLRPERIEIRNGNEYVFRCTPAQAEYYFLKFGKDAYIKEPEHLRNRMLKIYEKAYSRYRNNNERNSNNLPLSSETLSDNE